MAEEQNERFISGTVILEFGSNSCRPCKAMEPFLESVLGEYPEINLVKIDVQEEPHLASKFKVRGIPHLVFLQSGKEKGRLSGGHGAKKLKEFVGECLSKS
jgi:thioredoxin 1